MRAMQNAHFVCVYLKWVTCVKALSGNFSHSGTIEMAIDHIYGFLFAMLQYFMMIWLQTVVILFGKYASHIIYYYMND